MTLQDLQTTLLKLQSQGSLTVGSLTLAVPPMAEVLTQLPVDTSLALQGASLTLQGSGADQQLLIKTTLNWGLLQNLSSQFSVSVDATQPGGFIAAALFQLPPSTQLSLPGITWFQFSSFLLAGQSLPYALTRTGLIAAATMQVGATLKINGDSSQTAIPICIGTEPGGALALTLNTAAIDLPSINDILAALGPNGSAVQLPPGLNSLLNFSLQQLRVGMDPNALKVTELGVQIGNSAKVSSGWAIIPGYLNLQSYQIGLTVFDPFGTRQIGGLIATTATLGTVDIAVAAVHPASGGWDFRGAIGVNNPVPLGTLLIGLAQQFKVTLPDSLQKFTMRNFQFEFNTSTGLVTGQFELDFTVGSTPVALTVVASLTPVTQNQVTHYTPHVDGTLVIGGATFTVTIDGTPGATTFSARWSDTAQALSFGDIASAMGWHGMPALPENLDLALTDAEFIYNFSTGALALSAHSKHYGQLVFATLDTSTKNPTPAQRYYLLALDVPLNVALSDLPVVGDQLPANVKLGVKDLQIIVCSTALVADDVTALNQLLTGALKDTPLSTSTLGAGLTFATQLQLGTATQNIVIPLTGGSPSPAPAPSPSRAPTPAPSPAPAPAPAYQAGATWFNIEKPFGPVLFQRIGLQYQDGKLFFLLDAALNFSALSLACQGLGVGSALTAFSPQFHLDGIAVDFASGPITISGAMLNVPASALPKNVDFEYMGEVVIKVQPWMIAGVAAYAKVSDASSFFLFAQVSGAFGGPPAFFVTGFMGGFGYNSLLTLPAPDQVYQFPFVAGLDDPSIFGANPTPMSALSVLSGAGGKPPVVTPSVGDNWIAAGITFRSYEIILGHALLTVEFGNDLQIALLGLASTGFPQGSSDEAYAFIELQLEVLFKPSDGYFDITASLTPRSFLLTKDCHLTGGFAFCLWFGANEHAGDFVVTVGGYHPAFVKPSWYPQVLPVGFNWQVDSEVSIKGGAYFALTPSAIMAGASLEALFQAGCIKAWFIAYANLLISWKPFYFAANIGISIGASIRVDLLFSTVTLTFELGASLEMWGTPTGGIVHVHLYIISFSIPFGANSQVGKLPALTWDDFSTLLPQADKERGASSVPQLMNLAAVGSQASASTTPIPPRVLGLSINSGLSRQDDSGTWLVRADELSFSSQSAVPQTGLVFTKGTPTLAAGAVPLTPPASIAIRPMEVVSATSVHSISLFDLELNQEHDLSGWTQAPQTSNLPEAMWGAPLAKGATPAPSSAMVSGLPTGVRLFAPPASVGASPGAMDMNQLLDPLGGGFLAIQPGSQADPIAAPVVNAQSIQTIADTLSSTAAQNAQTLMLAALADLQAMPPTHDLLSQLAAEAGQAFAQAPLLAA
ncbi:MAG: hypothetical protein KKB08_04630 [Gammaproteobacteria bacterium]|nr:hypothetical protein [Gammaproteobacteria bacterium]